jgi:repressor LexA
MIDALVHDGDMVILRRAEQAKNGEMVAAWIKDGGETTLKYFYQEKGRIRLQPANPAYQPIYVDKPDGVEIQGKVVMVIRRLLV